MLSVPLSIKRNPQGGMKYVPPDLKELSSVVAFCFMFFDNNFRLDYRKFGQ